MKSPEHPIPQSPSVDFVRLRQTNSTLALGSRRARPAVDDQVGRRAGPEAPLGTDDRVGRRAGPEAPLGTDDRVGQRVGPEAPLGTDDQVGRRAARRALLGQIARLEGELVEQRCSTWPRPVPELAVGTAGLTLDPEGAAGAPGSSQPAGAGRRRGARLLDIGELEARRDDLLATLSAERHALAKRTLAEEGSRRLREELMLDPAAHAGARVRNADVGEGGCGDVRSEPVGGVLGMLMAWWRVVVSSGCP